MNPSFRCSSCNTRFRAEEKYVGRKVKCPNAACGQSIVLTLEQPPSTPPQVQVAASSTATSGVHKPSSSVSESHPSPRAGAQKQAAAVTASQSSASSQKATAATSTRRSKTTTARDKSSRYQSTSSAKPLFIGFALTLVLGGLALAGYWYSTVTPDSQVVANGDAATNMASTDSNTTAGSAGALEDGVSADGEMTPAAMTAALASSEPGKAQLTAALPDPRQVRNAERQRLLEEKVVPYLAKHCNDCHGADSQEAGVTIHELAKANDYLKDRKKWERVYRMINAEAMPPKTYDPQPEDAARKEVAEILYDELYNFDCTQVQHAGRSTLHRLNRAEYNNTIRDLFGLAIAPADKFPQDDVGEGFDNIGDVLSLPPLLMEKYLDAAEEVAGAVIDIRDYSKGTTQSFSPDKFKSSLDGNVNGEGFYVLHTNGTLTVAYDAPAAGKYKIRIQAAQTEAGDDPSNMALQIDGQTVHEFKVTGHRKPAWFEHEVTLPSGSRAITTAFTNDFYNEQAPEQRRDRNLGVSTIEVTGPEGGGAPQWHETHRRFVTARPSETMSVADAAATVLRPILYRGLRRPVSDAEVARFASLVEQTVNEQKESYEYGLYVALQALLVSPDFLFRKEADPEGGAKERALNEYEVASRLSYFLWSSMPDDELFQLAENKRLLDRTILRGQIERMLRHEKAASLGNNFASQWLNLRNLVDVRPNPEVFPEFDDALRTAMSQETILMFNAIVREDRSINEFLSADYSFVNQRLAKHYGIDGVNGDDFVRVSLQGTNRSGVLTHASILTLTSNPGRTSPVKRGKWILENILGDAPPPAPPGVPTLEEKAKDMAGMSLREQMEVHRKDPGCASCHKAMDPLGMGFENFDAVGRWREKEGDKAIDASGDLPSGEKFSGPSELFSIIRGREEKFQRMFAERLMVYALGRGLEYYDKCAVDQILVLMKERGNRFSALVEGIVVSDPFLKRSLTRESELTAQ